MKKYWNKWHINTNKKKYILVIFNTNHFDAVMKKHSLTTINLTGSKIIRKFFLKFVLNVYVNFNTTFDVVLNDTNVIIEKN